MSRLVLCVLALSALSPARGMSAAPPGVVETGAPSFVVLGPEALGLSTAPSDLHLLPDGRILIVAQRELTFGDGVRWETFHGTAEQSNLLSQVAVDPNDGAIYVGTFGGISRIELGETARWRFSPVEKFPVGAHEQLAGKVATFPHQWLWFGGGDLVLSWRPGETSRLCGSFGPIDRILSLDQDVYLSDQSVGKLFRLGPDGRSEVVEASALLVSESVTCAVPYAPGQILVGTVSAGLKLFDGRTFRPFGPPGLLNGVRRITDLCAAGENYFAAAVDTVGIVFFDREGRTVQVLERTLDHRLARVLRLRYSESGVLWALLHEGVARVGFPSPVSHFEPLVASGLVYPVPLRHAGQLWILGDGRAMRALYDAQGRLEHFVDDTPPGRYLFTLEEVDGQLFGTNEEGIYVRDEGRWRSILPGIINARLGVAPSAQGRIFYVARGEYGTIERDGADYRANRISLAGLGDSYNAVTDAAGISWIELGTGLVGRLDTRRPAPELQILGAEAGLERDWIEVYLLDGVARFHLRHLHLRFDEESRRFVDDRELVMRHPHLANAGGRPTLDRLGRLWFTAQGAPHAMDYTAGGGVRPIKLPAIDFFPTRYTPEDDGVVWMVDERRLARIDLRMPAPPELPLRALITSISFPLSNRRVFKTGAQVPPLDYSDNSIVVHFAAPANPFNEPISFEVMLDGADGQWVSTGTVGQAAFNHLKEGNYVFRVRPVAGGKRHGAEAQLAFSVRPPWYRSQLAWAAYALTALALVATAAWLSSFLQRRENERLERLVSARTSELNSINRQLGRQIAETSQKSAELAASEERYRSLNAELEQRVSARTSELSVSNRELQHRESLFRLVVEHAPVGISWKRADLDDVFHFNPMFRQILGLAPDAPLDRTRLFQFVHLDDRARQRELSELIESGASDSYNVEQRFVLTDGRIVWGSLSVAVVRDSAGVAVQHIGILEDITHRKQAEQELAATYKNLVATSRMAGMAEVATGVLHNVGNVLNSLNVSSNVIADGVQQAKTDLLLKLADLVDEHAHDLGEFIAGDPKGKLVPEVLRMLADDAAKHRDWLTSEIAAMQKNIDHIKEIVAMQQSYATMAGVVEVLEAQTLMEDALRMNEAALSRHEVTVVRDYLPVPSLSVEKGKVLQILINLIRNAKYACDDVASLPPEGKKITLRIEPAAGARVRFIVSDNGVGIAPENLTRIFAHGFTTRSYGHGFGLHSSALAAAEMKGSLKGYSDGLGRGATFILELPIAPQPAGDFEAPRAAFPEPAEPRFITSRRTIAPFAPRP